MSSSEGEGKNTRQSGKNYQIDLQAFSASRIRLETELRNNHNAIEILDTYCTDGTKFNEVNPLINPDGANPLYAVPDVFPNVPGQSSSFMVDLSDEGRPLAALFLDALPVTQFWKKVAQTLLYAEQQAELPATPTNRRPWRPDVCTVSNLLRVVCCVIFRGVVNTADTPSAFAGVDKPDDKRTGCAIFCGIT